MHIAVNSNRQSYAPVIDKWCFWAKKVIKNHIKKTFCYNYKVTKGDVMSFISRLFKGKQPEAHVDTSAQKARHLSADARKQAIEVLDSLGIEGEARDEALSSVEKQLVLISKRSADTNITGVKAESVKNDSVAVLSLEWEGVDKSGGILDGTEKVTVNTTTPSDTDNLVNSAASRVLGSAGSNEAGESLLEGRYTGDPSPASSVPQLRVVAGHDKLVGRLSKIPLTSKEATFGLVKDVLVESGNNLRGAGIMLAEATTSKGRKRAQKEFDASLKEYTQIRSLIAEGEERIDALNRAKENSSNEAVTDLIDKAIEEVSLEYSNPLNLDKSQEYYAMKAEAVVVAAQGMTAVDSVGEQGVPALKELLQTKLADVVNASDEEVVSEALNVLADAVERVCDSLAAPTHAAEPGAVEWVPGVAPRAAEGAGREEPRVPSKLQGLVPMAESEARALKNQIQQRSYTRDDADTGPAFIRISTTPSQVYVKFSKPKRDGTFMVRYARVKESKLSTFDQLEVNTPANEPGQPWHGMYIAEVTRA